MKVNEFFYPKPKRLPLGQRIKGKEYMGEKEMEWLFKSRLLIEEKMDGRQAYFETERFILWVEDLQRRHSIKYRIPGRYALFDVYDRKMMQFLNRDQKLQVWWDIHNGKIDILNIDGKYNQRPLIFPVPVIARTHSVLSEMASFIMPSAYAINKKGRDLQLMEGIVVKQDRVQFYFEYVVGKVVREEFEKGICTNYRNLPREDNIIDPSVPIIFDYPHI